MTAPLAVEEVLPDVWRLQIPLAFLEPPEVSIYLLRAPDGDVLVDAGMPGSEDAVDEALRRAGWSRSHINETVVTDEHPITWKADGTSGGIQMWAALRRTGNRACHGCSEMSRRGSPRTGHLLVGQQLSRHAVQAGYRSRP